MANRSQITVPRNSFSFPNLCSSCLKQHPLSVLQLTSDKGKLKAFYLFVKTYEHLQVAVPYCSECAHREIVRSRFGRLLILVTLIVSVALSIWLDLSRFQDFILCLVLVGPAILLADYRLRTVRVDRYDKDTITFSFTNEEFAKQFRQVNHLSTTTS